MKKIRTLLAFAAIFVLAFASVFAFAACEKHECGHVCPVEGCGKCLDKDCKDPACADKCPGHTPAPQPHVCGHVCPVEGCGKCTDANCTDPVCADKCPGHTPAPAHVCGHVCTVEGCGKCTDATCTDPVCADKCPGHTPAPSHECGHVCPVCGKCLDKTCTDPACADKCEHEFYTITLNAGDGTLAEGAKATYLAEKTSGKIVLGEGEFLPVPTIATANHHFDNWYDAETEGNAIDEETTVFTADTTLYARFVRDNGIWVGVAGEEVFKAALVKNTGASLTGGLKAEYWLGGSKVTLAKGDRITVVINGKQLSFYVLGSSSGIENVSTSTKQKSVTVSVAGEFEFYVKDYTNASDPNNWVCEFAGPTEVLTGSEIPAGCAPVHITWGGGEYEITFFILAPASDYPNGKPVGLDDFDEFCIYTFGGTGGELFGNWNNSAIAGKFALEMTSASSGMPQGWIFRRSAQQTKNIYNLVNHGVYLVEFTPQGNGDTPMTLLTISSKHTVTLDLGYAEQPETKVIAYNGKLTYMPVVSRVGYDFAGWYDAAEGGNEVTLDKEYSGDTTIYARWTSAKKVTLDLNYAEQPAEKEVAYAYGGKFSTLPVVEREGYDFLGWYNAATDGEAVTTDTEFTQDTTIYAYWKKAAKITFDLNYEGQPTEKQFVYVKNGHFTSVDFPDYATGYTGHESTGWYTLPEGGERITVYTEFTEDTTIYAQWRLPFVITFDLNYEGAPAATKLTADRGKLAALPKTPTREGYAFVNWYTVAAETGGSIVRVSKIYSEDTTVYARWRKTTFEVTFDLNYEGSAEPAKSNAANGKLTALPENPVREGYTFDGWFTLAEGGTAITLTQTYTADTTVYAHWTKTTIDVTFDLNYTDCPAASSRTTVDGKLTALPENPTRTGYTFDGWFTAATDGEQITLETVYTADTTVYAHWTAVEVTPETPETPAD